MPLFNVFCFVANGPGQSGSSVSLSSHRVTGFSVGRLSPRAAVPESLQSRQCRASPSLSSFAVNASLRSMLPPGLFLSRSHNKWFEEKSHHDINNIDIKSNPRNILILFWGVWNTEQQTRPTPEAAPPAGCTAHLLPPGPPPPPAPRASASHLRPEHKGELCVRQVHPGLRKPPEPKGPSLRKAEVWVR